MALDKDLWRQRIEPLSQAAFEYAAARWQRKTPFDEDVASEVRRLQEELRGVAGDLRINHPELHRELADTISEALLDLKYALNAPPGTSLRLHHFIENQESKDHST